MMVMALFPALVSSALSVSTLAPASLSASWHCCQHYCRHWWHGIIAGLGNSASLPESLPATWDHCCLWLHGNAPNPGITASLLILESAHHCQHWLDCIRIIASLVNYSVGIIASVSITILLPAWWHCHQFVKADTTMCNTLYIYAISFRELVIKCIYVLYISHWQQSCDQESCTSSLQITFHIIGIYHWTNMATTMQYIVKQPSYCTSIYIWQ